jgi:chromosome segregation ATPase
MSQAKEQPAAFDDVAARPGFEVALRGYDKRQVEQYVSRVDADISALMAERKRMLNQIHEMGGQLQRMQAELTEFRRRPPQIERASFRHLGPMVDQILALSEKQGEAIVATAAEKAQQAEKEAAEITAQGAQQLEHARAEAEAQIEAARAQVMQEVEELQSHTQQELARQTAVHQQQLAVVLHEIEGRQKVVVQLRSEVETSQQRLVQTRQEGAVAERELGQVQQRLGEVSQQLESQLGRLESARQAAESAERHAKEVRARVQREAERVANMAAAAVMAAAARGAEPTGEYPQVQQSGEQHPAGPTPPEREAPAQVNGHGHAIPNQRERHDEQQPERQAEPVVPDGE